MLHNIMSYLAAGRAVWCRAVWCREAFAVLQQELKALHKHMQAFHEQCTWSDGVYDGCGGKHR